MLVLDAFQSLITEIKATITSSSINTDLVIITSVDDLKIVGIRCCGEQTVQRPPKLYREWLLTGDHALSQTKRIKKPNMTLHCQWIITTW